MVVPMNNNATTTKGDKMSTVTTEVQYGTCTNCARTSEMMINGGSPLDCVNCKKIGTITPYVEGEMIILSDNIYNKPSHSLVRRLATSKNPSAIYDELCDRHPELQEAIFVWARSFATDHPSNKTMMQTVIDFAKKNPEIIHN